MRKKVCQKIKRNAQLLKVVRQLEIFLTIYFWESEDRYPTLFLNSGRALQKAASFREVRC